MICEGVSFTTYICSGEKMLVFLTKAAGQKQGMCSLYSLLFHLVKRSQVTPELKTLPGMLARP